ncbi:hypothetical protein Ssi03_11330 [Sphaerisporangium siamense]|uniref:Uncharacterized protein n=1 Tax=Sphaerisporangium siamense TaxID=795645 RepID=A0A7W7DA55_9ACTN|nr:hypothetical protein [Sphaerisporangium siamense]MBB4703092.1 hypothetical protein [Sphaerisporangium siamense]GII83143.1 hypothetical protein Ssi03_11330 [Sphaerisporangium siamense]
MPDAVEPSYRHLLDSYDFQMRDICVTWAPGTDAGDLAEALGADPSTAASKVLEDAYDESYERAVSGEGPNPLLVGRAGAWLVALEPLASAGRRRLATLSAGGEACCLTVGQGSYCSFYYARDGALVCRLVRLDDPEGDTRPLERHLAGLRLLDKVTFGVWLTHAFLLAERITGVHLGEDWFSDEHTRYFHRGAGA